MMNQDGWQLPEGVDELLPAQAAAAEIMRRSALDLFAAWGFHQVEPPLIEFTDSLLIGLGEDIALQSFRLTDQVSGRPMAVRADITAQAARIDAHSMKAKGVNRLCYAGAVLHTRPRLLAASRCPIMLGTELFGEDSVDGDVEVVSLMVNTLQTIEASLHDKNANACIQRRLQRLTIDLGHVAIYRAVVDQIKQHNKACTEELLHALFDAVQRKSAPDLKVLLPQVVSDPSIAEIVAQLPGLCGDVSLLSRARDILSPLGETVSGAIDQLQRVAEVVAERFPEVSIYLDLGELRGYGYHSGLVFAAYAEGFGEALANGGRYDGLGEVFGAERSATGFNTDVKALIRYFYNDGDVRQLSNDIDNHRAKAHIAAPNVDDRALWVLVRSLRTQGDVVVFTAAEALSQFDKVIEKVNGQWIVTG